jgi:hypothetical protein
MPWWNFDFTVLTSSGFGGKWATADEAKNAPDSSAEFLSNMLLTITILGVTIEFLRRG